MEVRLLGRPQIEDGDRAVAQPRGFKSWAVLARLALTDLPVSRQQLIREIFHTAIDVHGALRWALADLRRSLELPGALRGDPLSLSPREVWTDVWALADGSLPTAQIGPELLNGVRIRNCAAFDTWLELAREACASRSLQLLQDRAEHLLLTGQAPAAVAVTRRAVRLDPSNPMAQEQYIRALVLAGQDPESATRQVAWEAAFARAGLSPQPAFRAAISDRAASSPEP